ncbi:ABC transporter permease [Streptomyces canus]|uniref:ABC transporter permease n=1 Tax=Streptomyces TaxID=1883 RepID=UPI000B49AFAA|nr:ABC transporter permease [Streptomyces sp. LUP47B]
MSAHTDARTVSAKDSPEASPRSHTASAFGRLRRSGFWGKNAVYLGLLGVWLLFFILTPDFLTVSNVEAVLVSSAVAVVMAVGQTFVIVVGGIDLTIGSNVQFSGILLGVLFSTAGIGLGYSIPLTILGGLAVGAVVGGVIALFKINDFVVTLGGLSILSGAGLILSDGQPLSVRSTALLDFATDGFGGLKYFILVAVVVVAIGHVLMFYTRVGGHIRATGGNELAAREAGIATTAIKVTAYTICGCTAGIAALLLVARTGAADPNVGTSLLLGSIAAVVLGGASLKGGKGSVIGSAVGALLLTSLLNGFTLMQVSPFYQPIAVGGVVIASAIFNKTVKR